jgi:hypothetical protein
VGAVSCPAGYYHILLGYLILDGEASVGESSAVRCHVPFDTLATMHLLGNTGTVEDVVGSEKFVYLLEVSPSENLIEPSADQCFVFFAYRHLLQPASYQRVVSRFISTFWPYIR